MSGLLHLGFIVLAFVKWRRLGSAAGSTGSPSIEALHVPTGCAVLVALVLLCLSAYYQQPWYKMKSWEEIAKAEREAAARGIQLTHDEAEGAARMKLLAVQGRAKLGLYGAVLSTVLLMGLSLAVGQFARVHPLKVFSTASLGIVASAIAVFFFLQQPWGSARKSLEAEEVVRARWVNDPPPSAEILEKAVASREYKEKKGTVAFLVAALVVIVAGLAGGGLGAWQTARSGSAVPWIRRLRRSILLAAIAGLLSMVFRLPGASGVIGTSSNEQAYFHLRDILRAETEYRERDLDGNKIEDWWVADVSGLSRLLIGGAPIGRLSGYFVQMDGAPLDHGNGRIQLETTVRDAKMVFPLRIRVISESADGTRYAQDLDGDGNAFESTRGFAFCCYPSKYGDQGAVETLIIDQTGVVWRKDLGGAAIDRWPADPEKEGWKKWVEGRRRPERYILAREDE